ncbi:hypothetical protein C8R43DRAFT_846606, partial [Mycena crocata]
TVHGHALSQLFCFVNLTNVILKPPVGFDIDDATAWDMARAWPRLDSLVLETATDFSHPPSMSLAGLRAFAKHCPKLTSLTIAVDASSVPAFDDSPETRISQLGLRILDVSTSPISDPPAIARFMSALFPAL